MSTKLNWYINRLRAMSVQEIAFRFKKTSKDKINKVIYKNKIDTYEINNKKYDISKINNRLNKIFNEINLENFCYKSTYKIFHDEINIEDKITWNKGMKSNWDNDKFSKDIDFKNTDEVGDVRYSWEVNRHQFLVGLALNYKKTKNKKYLDILEKHFYDWSDENKFLKGINWNSSMEIAIRSYQWLIIIFILNDIDRKKFKNDIVNFIINSTKYVMNNLSLFSSANNHLILEVAISSIIGYCFEDIIGQNWFKKGYEILNRELKNQFFEDGVNKEQALHYQAFVTDIMLQYNTVMKKIGVKPIEEEIMRKSVEFVYNLKANKIYIDFGDSDDAKIINFNCDIENYYDYILELGSYYYETNYLNGLNGYKEVELFYNYRHGFKEPSNNMFNVYINGGYSIIKNNNDLLLFDFGPLGFGSLAAHGHADALMIIYYKGCNGFFIDPGTYIYNIEKDKRNYYRSTEEHNTVCYKGENQSEMKGPFLWGKKSNSKLVRCEESKDSYIIEAINDGYNPNLHKRRLEYKKEYGSIAIYDFFDDEAEINYILDNNVKIEKLGEKILKLTNNTSIYVYIDGEIQIKNSNISKKFLEETVSKKINIKYSFKKEHLTLIADNMDKLKLLMVEKGR